VNDDVINDDVLASNDGGLTLRTTGTKLDDEGEDCDDDTTAFNVIDGTDVDEDDDEEDGDNEVTDDVEEVVDMDDNEDEEINADEEEVELS
jgi:hypothetical protein